MILSHAKFILCYRIHVVRVPTVSAFSDEDVSETGLVNSKGSGYRTAAQSVTMKEFGRATMMEAPINGYYTASESANIMSSSRPANIAIAKINETFERGPTYEMARAGMYFTIYQEELVKSIKLGVVDPSVQGTRDYSLISHSKPQVICEHITDRFVFH